MKGLLYTYEILKYTDDELIKDILLLDDILFSAMRDQLTKKDWEWHKEISEKYHCDKIDIENIDWEKNRRINVDFSESGEFSYRCFKNNGKPDGLWTEWYENGQKKQEGTYKDGEKDGLETFWGKRDGTWTYWYDNGRKKSEGTYKDGKKDGLWNKWGSTALNKQEGTNKDGLQVGDWVTCDQNGIILKVENFD